MSEEHGYQVFLVEFPDSVTNWCRVGSGTEQGTSIWVDGKGKRRPTSEGRPIHTMRVEREDNVLDADPMFLEIIRRSADEHLIEPASDQGWIDPDGIFYGCGYWRHDDLAHLFFGCRVGDLEHAGYVRVHSDTYRFSKEGTYGDTVAPEPSKDQWKTLAELGFYDTEKAFSKRLPEDVRPGVSSRRLYVPGGRVRAPVIGKAAAGNREDLRLRRERMGLDKPSRP